ncbi:hypothetical protein MMC26_006673 [Xylographa opegraphella]|nr:hypothetical protein [Xylographa opegraphella]
MKAFKSTSSGATSSTVATNLYISSYGNTITTLALGQAPSYKLEVTSTIDSACNPGWLVVDSETRNLYCIGEGLGTSTEGALSTFIASSDGRLIRTSHSATPLGGCSGVFFRNERGGLFLAIAHYQGSALSTWRLNHPSDTNEKQHQPNGPVLWQTIDFVLASPGLNPIRQEMCHPHQVILDPTGKFIICPDLGADVIRTFAINQSNGMLEECPAFAVAPGAGPRHAIFVSSPTTQGAAVTARSVLLYVVFELTNTITSYKATYPPNGSCPSFKAIETSSTFGDNPIPVGAAVAEISLVGDDLIIISNRNSPLSFSASSSDLSPVKSDPLSIFRVYPDGTFKFLELAPAGGSFPRHFSVNQAGDLIAVGLQMSGKVVILERDAENGQILEPVAEVDGLGEVTCVVWDE